MKCGLYPRVSALPVVILCTRDGDLGKGPILTTVVLYIRVFSLNLRVHVTSVKKERNLNRLFAFFSGNKTKFEFLSSDVQESLKWRVEIGVVLGSEGLFSYVNFKQKLLQLRLYFSKCCNANVFQNPEKKCHRPHYIRETPVIVFVKLSEQIWNIITSW